MSKYSKILIEKLEKEKVSHLGQARQSKKCKCGHLKDEHYPTLEGDIICTRCSCLIKFT